MKKAALVVLVCAVILGVAFWWLSPRMINPPQDEGIATLNYWGLWDDESTIRPLIETYQTTHPKVKIIYNKQTLLNFRTRVQTQIREEAGPDIFMIHSSWMQMFLGDLSAVPTDIMTASELSKTFYPMVKSSLTINGKIYGMPIDLDGLALYYNEDILRGVGAKPPSNWQEFVEVARKVTVKDTSGQIQTAGASLGTVTNVDFWPEILSLLFFQQPEGKLDSPAAKDGIEVMQFYTSFITDPRTKTWDVNLPSSTLMFSQGRLAFYFAPLKQAQTFTLSNPDLHFKVIGVPQLPGRNVGVGSFWALSVSNKSKHQRQAWDFVKFLTSAENLQQLSESMKQTQGYQKLYPRLDMANLQQEDPLLAPFVKQAPFYKSWYLNSNTGDLGLNDEMIKAYEVVVNDTLSGKDILGSLQTAQIKIKEILDKYTKVVVEPTRK